MTDAKPADEKELEKLIEAQAEGKDVAEAGVPVDPKAPKGAVLDRRASKFGPIDGVIKQIPPPVI